MSEIPIETKLQLIQKIREDNQQNHAMLHNREAILYGKGSNYAYERTLKDTVYGNDSEHMTSFSGLKIRIVIAVLLFIGYFVLDTQNRNIAGYDAKQIQTVMNQDFEYDGGNLLLD